MSKSLGGISGSHPTGQTPAGLVALRVDPGRIQCDGCGKFMSYADCENGRARFEFTPLNEFGPEESAWVCPRCIAKGL